MCLSRPTRRKGQQHLTQWTNVNNQCIYQNIEPNGDPLVRRFDDDGVTRMGYHNINGSDANSGLQVASEIEVIHELGLDVQAMSEIKRPWSAGRKWEYNTMLEVALDQPRAVFAAGMAPHDCKFLPGGNLLTTNGSVSGRIIDSGSDKWGRFCWFTLRGRRDEGILVITAYRVCHEASDNPGPLTAYTREYVAMREAGIEKPNPRRQILDDITELIDEKRLEGYRPIVMMDANGDYNNKKSGDSDLREFIENAGLVDPYHERYPEQIRTFMFGTKRLDYILMDPALAEAVVRIGYLGSHDAAFSDHVQAYVDFDTSKLFRGTINRPIDVKSREFRLEQTNKKVEFVEDFIPAARNATLKEKVFKLAENFVKHGRTSKNETMYQKIDQIFTEMALGSAHKVSRKKFGYMRNPELTKQGRIFILSKMVQDCKARNAPLPQTILDRAHHLAEDVSGYDKLSNAECRKDVRKKHKGLWDAQKGCEQDRIEWLKGEAMERAKAAGDPDWEARLREMILVAESRAINRKLTTIIKGNTRALDRIEIPTHDWFHSNKEKEIYHYDCGNFEAHPAISDTTFFRHHTLKVIPPDATQILVAHKDTCIEMTFKTEWYYSFSHDGIYHWNGDVIESFRCNKEGIFSVRRSRDGGIPNDAVVAVVERIEHGKYRLIETIPIEAHMWKDVTTHSTVETLILERNKRHLQQTDMEGGVNRGPIMTDLRKEHGLSGATDSLLRGEYVTEHTVSPEMAAWFNEVKQTDQERECEPIVGCMTKDDFQFAFKQITEKTSSSPSGLHYTIWKALAANDWCAEFLCIMISLPFMYGFANKRWTKLIDVMLEKKKGVRKIHTLRIIGLLEGDFNTALKWFMASQVQRRAEDNNAMSKDQFGSRKDRMAIDAGMIKLLSFESARATKSTMAEVSHDKKACFDRMQTAQSNIYAKKQNVDKNLLICKSKTMSLMKRHVKTGLGVSEAAYYQVAGEPIIEGETQGKPDVPVMYGLQSSTLLRAHTNIAPGLELKSCTGRRSICHNNIAFVDDTDGRVSAATDSEHPTGDVISAIQDSAQKWSDLVNITGGSLAMHKTEWRLLAWEWRNGDWKLIQATEEEVVLEDGKGAYAVIQYRGPSECNKGLGFRLCPDGNQKHQFEAIRDSIRTVCGAVKTAHLTEKEAIQALFQRILPKLAYPLHLAHLNKEQCTNIDACIRQAVFPQMRLNRNYPKAVAYGPVEYGGMELPETYTLQDQLQISYLLRSLRWDSTVANDLLVTLDNIQLNSGLVTPIFEETATRLDYLDNGHLVALRNRMSAYDASLWIEEAWAPKLQRVGDRALMEAFGKIVGITKRMLEKANAVRLYLRVITIADLADPAGEFIPAGMLTGHWQAGSDLQWARQESPPKRAWTVFRRCLRVAFCNRTPPNQRAHHSLNLDRTMGTWYPVERNTWWPCYRAANAIYRRDEDTGCFEEFREKDDLLGFFQHKGTTTDLPVESHPIRCQHVGSRKLWTHKKMALQSTCVKAPQIGHDVHNTLPRGTGGKLITGSDGSVHLRQKLVASAWMATADTEHHRSACFLMTDCNSVSSYRSELEGIFRLLKNIDPWGLEPDEVEHWCDNERSVISTEEEPYGAASMMHADADLRLAIHHLKKQLPFKFKCRHVYGHQDGKNKGKMNKKKKKQQNDLESQADSDTEPTELVAGQFRLRQHIADDNESTAQEPTKRETKMSNEAQINVGCDHIASGTTGAMLGGGEIPPEPILKLPYPGSKALLKIGDKWITSRYKKAIHKATSTPPMRTYCNKRFKWRNNEFDMVYWDAIGTVRRGFNDTKKMLTSKIMHGWLPVGHKRQHITGVNQCPGCPCNDETIHHLFVCPHARMVETRTKAFKQMLKLGRKAKIKRSVIEAVCHVMKEECAGTDRYILPTHAPAIRDAIDEQRRIGMPLMMRGFLAKKWFDAIETSGSKHPERRMIALQRMLWIEWVEPIWHTRNDILHGGHNNTNDAESQRLADRLLWYRSHRENLLAHHDQSLARFDLTSIQKMRRGTRRECVRQLDIARVAYEKEKFQIGQGQSTLHRYFGIADVTADPSAEGVT